MRNFVTLVCIGLLGFSIACNKKGGAAAGEAKALTDPWGSFNVGSFVKQKMTSVTNVAGQKSTTSSEIKQTLVSKTADKAVVEVETTVMGMASKTTIEIPLNVSAAAATAATQPAATSLGKGSETLTVAGKPIECQWIETETNQGGNKTSVKLWNSSAVPGGVVKSVSKTSGAMEVEATTEVVDFKTT